MLQFIKQIHDFANNQNLKLAPKKIFFVLHTVKYLGLENGFNAIQPIQSEFFAIQRILSPITKIKLMRFFGSMKLYSKFIDKLNVFVRVSFCLLPVNINYQWNIELEILIQQFETSITKHVTLRLPKTNHPVFVNVVSSLFGIGCVLIHRTNKGELDIFSDISPSFTNIEQNLCTT